MNETFIKEIIKYKVKAASTIISHLPPKMSEEIKSLSRTILESVNESSREIQSQSVNKTKTSHKLDNVPIE